MDAQKMFYEALLARTVAWLFLLFICVLGLVVPAVRSSPAAQVAVYAALLLIILSLARAILTKRVVLALEANGIVVRGVRPGMWKLFQCWVVERIHDASVNSIKVGYLREKRLRGIVSYPPGEPSKGAMFQMFLWVKYNTDRRQMDIYYPHPKNVSGFVELINCLESRYGSKVETFL